MYYLYILKSGVKNWHYIGSTSDIYKRIARHNSGKVKSTKPYRPLVLLYKEQFLTNREARQKELFLKKTAKARKELFEKIDKASSSSLV